MTTWTEITEERYDEMLGALPPAVWTVVGFLVGEPMDHDPVTSLPRYSAFAQANGKFYAANEVMTAREFRAVKVEDVK